MGSNPTTPTMKYDYMLNGIPTKPGIYMWRNKLNDKRYIGQAVNVYARIRQHLESFEKNREHKYFYYAINKDGIENFEVSVIKTFDLVDNIKDILDQEEIFYIKEYKCMECGYNRTTGGDGGVFGCFCCEETQEKLRKAAIEKIEEQRAAGRFDFFIYDIKTKKLYTCNSEQKAAEILKVEFDAVHGALTRFHKLQGRFVLGKTREAILDKLNRKRGSSRLEIKAMISYLKEHSKESDLSIAGKFEVSTATIRKYRKELGIYNPRPKYRITKDGEVFEGCYTRCAKVIGVNPSTLYRNLPNYLEREYRGWKLEEI